MLEQLSLLGCDGIHLCVAGFVEQELAEGPGDFILYHTLD